MNLEGDRVDLKPFTNNIIQFLFNWHRDPVFDSMMSQEVGPKSEYDIQTRYGSMVKSGRVFVVTEHGQDIPVGIVCLINIDTINRKAEIYGGLGDKRNQGLGAEALKMMVSWGVEQLGLQRIYANIISTNKESINLLQNAGFKKEAEFKNEIYQGGRFHNRVVMGFNLASDLPANIVEHITGFLASRKDSGKKVHGGYVEMLNEFCEYVRKTGGDE